MKPVKLFEQFINDKLNEQREGIKFKDEASLFDYLNSKIGTNYTSHKGAPYSNFFKDQATNSIVDNDSKNILVAYRNEFTKDGKIKSTNVLKALPDIFDAPKNKKLRRGYYIYDNSKISKGKGNKNIETVENAPSPKAWQDRDGNWLIHITKRHTALIDKIVENPKAVDGKDYRILADDKGSIVLFEFGAPVKKVAELLNGELTSEITLANGKSKSVGGSSFVIFYK